MLYSMLVPGGLTRLYDGKHVVNFDDDLLNETIECAITDHVFMTATAEPLLDLLKLKKLGGRDGEKTRLKGTLLQTAPVSGWRSDLYYVLHCNHRFTAENIDEIVRVAEDFREAPIAREIRETLMGAVMPVVRELRRKVRG